VRLLDEVPQTPLVLGELAGAKVLLHLLLDVGRLLLHLVDDVLLPGVELVLAARLQVDLVDAPEVEVLREGHDAHLVDDVEPAGPVEVEHGVEGPRVPVEEVLVVDERVGVAQVQDLLVGRRLGGEPAEPRPVVDVTDWRMYRKSGFPKNGCQPFELKFKTSRIMLIFNHYCSKKCVAN